MPALQYSFIVWIGSLEPSLFGHLTRNIIAVEIPPSILFHNESTHVPGF